MWFQNKEASTAASMASQEKQILESLLNNVDDGVVFYDVGFKILIFNKAAEKIFDLPAGKIVGQNFSLEQAQQSSSNKLLAAVMFPSLAPTVARQTAEGVYPQVIDLILENPKRELRISLDKIFSGDNQMVGFVKIIRDKTKETNVSESQKEFVTLAAHRLRTPATAVSWSFDNLKNDPSISLESQETIRIGSLAGKSLLKIIDDLLNIAQIEKGGLDYNFQQINLIEFLDKLLAEADAIAKEYNVKVYLERPSNNILVWADAAKLSIAVSNLIDNAIKYNIANGEVAVRIEAMGDFFQVSVKDNGIGITESELKNLFNKFFRGANIAQTKVAGSGLGLYIAKKIIERHGGKIWAESVVNRGTTFYFTLPTELKLIPSR